MNLSTEIVDRGIEKPLSTIHCWPVPPHEAAFHGLGGEFVHLVEPVSEADRVALLVQFLAAFGSIIGRTAHFTAEATRHFSNLFVLIVGTSSKARKGSSWSHVERVFGACDLIWAADRVKGGLSSGEGLIWQVRDPIFKMEAQKERGRSTGDYQKICTDPGIDDKRLLLQEAEFSAVLRMIEREGNSLSALLRKAWENGNLESLTKTSPAKSTEAHVSIVGHIVKDEVKRYLGRTEVGNGFANRFIWICAKRSKAIVDEIPPDALNLTPLTIRLKAAIESARDVGCLHRDPQAQEIWRGVYPELSEGKPGLFGSITSRAEAQVMRLACLYALLDGASTIGAPHLRAALALWEYSEASARFIFGDELGDPVADEILRNLRGSQTGLTRTQISEIFGRNRNRDQIGQALSLLAEHGLAHMIYEDSGGRKAERWFVISG